MFHFPLCSTNVHHQLWQVPNLMISLPLSSRRDAVSTISQEPLIRTAKCTKLSEIIRSYILTILLKLRLILGTIYLKKIQQELNKCFYCYADRNIHSLTHYSTNVYQEPTMLSVFNFHSCPPSTGHHTGTEDKLMHSKV